MPKLTILCMPMLLATLASCAIFGTEPTMPALLDPASPSMTYRVDEFERDRSDYLLCGDVEKQKGIRNRVINRLRVEIRNAHVTYETEVSDKVANWNIETDFAQLSLALAATVTKGREAKTVLAAVIAAVTGAKLSVDKNRFREKASEILVAAMRGARIRKDTAIQAKLALSVVEYPLEEGLCDIVDLFHSGTIVEAFQSLAQTASKEEASAREEAKVQQDARTGAKQQAAGVKLE